MKYWTVVYVLSHCDVFSDEKVESIILYCIIQYYNALWRKWLELIKLIKDLCFIRQESHNCPKLHRVNKMCNRLSGTRSLYSTQSILIGLQTSLSPSVMFLAVLGKQLYMNTHSVCPAVLEEELRKKTHTSQDNEKYFSPLKTSCGVSRKIPSLLQ